MSLSSEFLMFSALKMQTACVSETLLTTCIIIWSHYLIEHSPMNINNCKDWYNAFVFLFIFHICHFSSHTSSMLQVDVTMLNVEV